MGRDPHIPWVLAVAHHCINTMACLSVSTLHIPTEAAPCTHRQLYAQRHTGIAATHNQPRRISARSSEVILAATPIGLKFRAFPHQKQWCKLPHSLTRPHTAYGLRHNPAEMTAPQHHMEALRAANRNKATGKPHCIIYSPSCVSTSQLLVIFLQEASKAAKHLPWDEAHVLAQSRACFKQPNTHVKDPCGPPCNRLSHQPIPQPQSSGILRTHGKAGKKQAHSAQQPAT